MSKQDMDRSEALRTLVYESGRDRFTKSGWKSCEKACKALALTDYERINIMQYIGYYGANMKPHQWLTQKNAPK